MLPAVWTTLVEPTVVTTSGLGAAEVAVLIAVAEDKVLLSTNEGSTRLRENTPERLFLRHQ